MVFWGQFLGTWSGVDPFTGCAILEHILIALSEWSLRTSSSINDWSSTASETPSLYLDRII